MSDEAPEVIIRTYGKGRYFDEAGNPLDEAACAEIDARCEAFARMMAEAAWQLAQVVRRKEAGND